MSKQPDYTNDSQQCLIACLEYLSQNILTPQTVSDVTTALAPDYNRDQVFRTLWNLKKSSWVTEASTGYLLSPDMTKFSDRLRLQLININRQYLLSDNYA